MPKMKTYERTENSDSAGAMTIAGNAPAMAKPTQLTAIPRKEYMRSGLRPVLSSKPVAMTLPTMFTTHTATEASTPDSIPALWKMAVLK